MNYLLVFLMTFLIISCDKKSEVVVKGDKATAMYSLGHRYAYKMKNLNPSKDDMKVFIQGLEDGLAGKTQKGVDIEAGLKISEQILNANRVENAKERQANEKEQFDKFVDENELEKQESGLFLKIIAEGSDERIGPKDKFVQLRFVGKKLDGSIFDKTSDQNLPIFPVNAVISAWQEALQTIGVGGKVLLLSPPELAFGDNGAPPRVQGGESVVFEIELIAKYSKYPTKK